MNARDLRVFLIAGLMCAAIQIVSASASSRSLESPNLSTSIAERLAASSVYGTTAWAVLRGPHAPAPAEMLRAYQLPGEALYLAAGFRWLPAWSWRWLQVPIVVLLVLCVGAAAFRVGGRRMALAAMALVALDPFIVIHGPVWDDTVLGVALEWAVVAALVSALHDRSRAGRSVLVAGLAAIAAGVAGVTRATSFFGLLGVTMTVLLWPRLRAARLPAGAALTGLAVGKLAWGLRNLMVLGVFFTGATDTGIAIWRANAATARESLWTTGVTEGISLEEIAPMYARASALDEIAADRMYRRATLARLMSAPIDCAHTALLKMGASLSGVDLSRPLAGVPNLPSAMFNVGMILLGLLGWRRLSPVASPAIAGLRVSAACLVVVTIAMLAVGTVGLRYRLDVGVAAALGASALVGIRSDEHA